MQHVQHRAGERKSCMPLTTPSARRVYASHARRDHTAGGNLLRPAPLDAATSPSSPRPADSSHLVVRNAAILGPNAAVGSSGDDEAPSASVGQQVHSVIV